VLVLAAVAAGWVAPAPAEAAPAVEVDAGYFGTYVPGQPVPVRVRVTADRLLSGELQVLLGGVPASVPIEVPGGTKKEFMVVMPTMAAPAPLTVTARLPDGSRSPPSANALLTPAGNQEAVGLLPGALGGRPLPGTAPLAVDAGTARFVALGPLELERAPDALLALGTIGIGADELARQAPSVRTGLLRWVETGGRLLVDAAPGTRRPSGSPPSDRRPWVTSSPARPVSASPGSRGSSPSSWCTSWPSAPSCTSSSAAAGDPSWRGWRSR
jgi:hypothetical protein